MRTEPTQRAIDLAGGVNALARTLGIRSASVAQWPRIPAERCQVVAQATGIPLHELRPDIYPMPPSEDRRADEKATPSPQQADEAA